MVANLKRYDPFTISDQGYRQSAFMGECGDGEYVKFEEAMEASSNSLQQLKAKIAALAAELEIVSNDFCGNNRMEYVKKLRQLSAV